MQPIHLPVKNKAEHIFWMRWMNLHKTGKEFQVLISADHLFNILINLN